MKSIDHVKRIAILGGGPSGLFLFKRLIESGNDNVEIDIFEKHSQLGTGMPYSTFGANDEHITNVSGNEIPLIVTSIEEWLQNAPKETLKRFNIDALKFNEYKVLPRLLFGQYLSAQFDLLLIRAKENDITCNIHFNSNVIDIIDMPELDEVWVRVENAAIAKFDTVIISTGHNWPIKHEGTVPGYYDSPYPPSKLSLQIDHAVAIKGSSLTAIDAIRTLARCNGTFEWDDQGKLLYKPATGSSNFKIILHSRSGLLPAIRFHLEDSHLSPGSLLNEEQLAQHIQDNDGFLSLDMIFEKDFKNIIRNRDESFYEHIRDMNMETFVNNMMELRERLDPFLLFKAEYTEAAQSIKRHESVYWKEMLAVLSYAMNYPAKHLSAEDMQRLQKVLMPLISIVIAFVPQSSAEEIIALYDAGVLNIIAVGADSKIEPLREGGITYHYIDEAGQTMAVQYKTFIDCVGQPHLSYYDLPFKSLVEKRTVSAARLKFRSTEKGKAALEEGNELVEKDNSDTYYLKVPGITINDDFRIIDPYGAYNDRIFIMAVPYIAGYNPDYSGLDFCAAASTSIIKRILEN